MPLSQEHCAPLTPQPPALTPLPYQAEIWAVVRLKQLKVYLKGQVTLRAVGTDLHAFLDLVGDCLEALRDESFYLTLWHDPLPSYMFMVCSYAEVTQEVNHTKVMHTHPAHSCQTLTVYQMPTDLKKI